jgi:hypothetical protein
MQKSMDMMTIIKISFERQSSRKRDYHAEFRRIRSHYLKQSPIW